MAEALSERLAREAVVGCLHRVVSITHDFTTTPKRTAVERSACPDCVAAVICAALGEAVTRLSDDDAERAADDEPESNGFRSGLAWAVERLRALTVPSAP